MILLSCLVSSTVIANINLLRGQQIKILGQGFDEAAIKRLTAWNEMIVRYKQAPFQEKLSVVNRFFNQLPFLSDSKHWGKKDYWATPLEFVVSNGGDCEDFVLAKYYTLKRLGIPEGQLRLMYVEATNLNQAHMVLSYQSPIMKESYILDNLIAEIEPFSTRNDLKAVYSFNADGLWLNLEDGRSLHLGKADRLSLWQDFQQRVRGPLFDIGG